MRILNCNCNKKDYIIMNYCKLFRDHAGKEIEVIMTNGEKFNGKLVGYISALDNEPEPESILVDYTEIYTNEIAAVNVLV